MDEAGFMELAMQHSEGVLSLTDVVRRRAEVAIRSTPTGAILVDLASGLCWQLNRLGADFLTQIEGERSLNEVCDELERRYDVSREVLERDLSRLTQELSDAGLIESFERKERRL